MRSFVCVIALLCASIAAAQDAKSVVERINANNAKIKSLVMDIENVMQKRNMTFTAHGRIFYEKDKNLRMTATQDVSGQQACDIGSNDGYFWFWVRKLDPRTMYFSAYKDLYRTGLRDSLHPLWLIESLSIGQVDIGSSKVYNSGGYAVAVRNAKNPRGEPCLRMTYCDPAKPAIAGHRVYDSNQQILSTVEVQDWFSTNAKVYIPRVIVVGWKTEGIRVTQTFSNLKVNVPIPADTWKMPRMEVQVVNMGQENINWDRYREEN